MVRYPSRETIHLIVSSGRVLHPEKFIIFNCQFICKKSERQDLNLRPLPPQGSTLPSCATSRYYLFMLGRLFTLGSYATNFLSQTILNRLFGRVPRPDIFCYFLTSKVYHLKKNCKLDCNYV